MTKRHEKKYAFEGYEVTLVATGGYGMETRWWPPVGDTVPDFTAGQRKAFDAIVADFKLEILQLGIEL